MRSLALAVLTGLLVSAGVATAAEDSSAPSASGAPSGAAGNGAPAGDSASAPPDPNAAEQALTDRLGFDALPEPSTPPQQNASEQDASDLLGFGAPAGAVGQDQPAQVSDGPATSSVSLRGFVRGRTAVWAERLSERPLGKAWQSLDLELRYRRDVSPDLQLRLQLAGHAEYDLAYSDPPPLTEDGRASESGQDDRATVEAYRSLITPREAFVAGVLTPVELLAGYQIIPWGQGELLSVVDVINPRDLREPGLDDLDDIRVPVLAARARGNFGEHTIEYVLVPKASWGFLPPPLAPFSPVRELIGAQVPEGLTARWKHTPRRFGDEMQLFGRWTWKGSGLDLEFHAARLLDRGGVLLAPNPDSIRKGGIDLELEHLPYIMVGHSGASPFGSWLLRWELGADFGRPFAVSPTEDGVVAKEVNVVNGLVGLNYAGFSRTNLTFDATYSVLAHDIEPLVPVQYPTLAFRGTHTEFNERLTLSGVLVAFGLQPSHGWLARAELSYSVLDSLSVSVGYVTYHPEPGPGPIAGFDSHDRLYASWRYDFQMLN